VTRQALVLALEPTEARAPPERNQAVLGRRLPGADKGRLRIGEMLQGMGENDEVLT
jgi:hypothetical protein